MKTSIRLCLIIPALLAVCPAPSAAQPLAFEDVIRNLRNPDPKVRISSVRLLRDASYPEAVVPMARLVNDPIDEIQLEVIAAELSFFLVEPVPPRRKVALLVEVRSDDQAGRAFEMGPLVAWPKPAPAELISELLKALDDEHPKVRQEAIYTLGVIGAGAIAGENAEQLIKALDHYDPAIRAGAARVIGRVRLPGAGESLMKAMNDSSDQVRKASMRALGDLREESAVKALNDQLIYSGKGEPAYSALDALARIAHPSSAPLFKERLADRDPWMRRAAAEGLGRLAEASAFDALHAGVGGDDSEMVRAAMAFALLKIGRGQVVRLVDYLDSKKMAPQIHGYLLELGPAIVPELLPRLQEPGDTMRCSLVDALGALGDQSTVTALSPLLQQGNREIVKAAARAIERIKLRTQGADS
jgi:HEAT repeat protein